MVALILFIILGGIITQGYGSQLTEIDVREIMDEAYHKIFTHSDKIKVPFYQITMNSDSQKNHHYLLGTLHGLPKKFFKEEIIQAIKESGTLVTEIHTPLIRDYPELGEFSELSREDIGIKGFLWNKSSPWTPLLCSDHLKLIREGIEVTLKKAWGLELDEIHPILVGSIIDQNIQMKAAFTEQGEEPMDIFIAEYFGLLTNKIIGLENYSDRLNASDGLENFK